MLLFHILLPCTGVRPGRSDFDHDKSDGGGDGYVGYEDPSEVPAVVEGGEGGELGGVEEPGALHHGEAGEGQVTAAAPQHGHRQAAQHRHPQPGRGGQVSQQHHLNQVRQGGGQTNNVPEIIEMLTLCQGYAR